MVWARQDPPRGTGDAVHVGLGALGTWQGGPLLILNGDLPLLGEETLREMLEAHRRAQATMTLLSLKRRDPRGYGRVRRAAGGSVAAIIEEADATGEEKRIEEVNGGVYLAEVEPLRRALADWIAEHQRRGGGKEREIYFPPVIDSIVRRGGKVADWQLPAEREDELQQVNDRVELATVSRLRRRSLLRSLQLSGVTVVDPSTTYIEEDVSIGQDTVIHPFTVIEAGVRIGERCQVGPFARLRIGTGMADESQIGNFTEVKNTSIGRGSKAKHLTYLGDGEVGAGVNIGAGTIFANYDGRQKWVTTIEDGSFVGSGTIFVAPVTMGKGSQTGAGAVVVSGRNIPPGATVVGVPGRELSTGPAAPAGGGDVAEGGGDSPDQVASTERG